MNVLVVGHSSEWLIVSGIIGGVIGASVKFAFEDVLGPRLGYRREVSRLVARYTVPLLRSAESLERHFNNMVLNDASKWVVEDEYYRLSSLYVFGEYLGWIRMIERRFGFLPVEATRRGAGFRRHLYGPYRGLTGASYFPRTLSTSVAESAIPRRMLTAIGEVVITLDHESIIDFTEFCTRMTRDAQFSRWFRELDQFLRTANVAAAPYVWDKLIITNIELRALIPLP